MEGPTLEQRKGIRWKEGLRGSATHRLCLSLSLTVLLVGWVAGSERSEARKRERKGAVSLLVFVSHYLNLFSLTIH